MINLDKFPAALKLAHILVALQNRLTLKVTLAGFKADLDSENLIRFGTPYGGWWVPKKVLSMNEPKVLVSAGLGHDTSFDAEMLINNFFVIGLDPLIECCTRAERELSNLGEIKVLNKGISTFTGEQRFFQPKNPNHDSWSTINVQAVENGEIESFQVISITDLVIKFPRIRNSSFSYLKMDIEGAELAILKNSFSEIEDFNFVGIEMDFLSLIPFLALKQRVKAVLDARRVLKRFHKARFALVNTENFNFFWEKQ